MRSGGDSGRSSGLKIVEKSVGDGPGFLVGDNGVDGALETGTISDAER